MSETVREHKEHEVGQLWEGNETGFIYKVTEVRDGIPYGVILHTEGMTGVEVPSRMYTERMVLVEDRRTTGARDTGARAVEGEREPVGRLR